MPETNHPFKIGLCMAGAVSAGTYTAGAIDYLIEALDEWQRRKESNDPSILGALRSVGWPPMCF